jgi:hypothetical protein
MQLLTASWLTEVPPTYVKIGISRGTPRGQPAGYRLFKALAPGPWFNSVGVREYRWRYQAEVLDQLDPAHVLNRLEELAGGRVAVMCCFETPDGVSWCHRAMAAVWLHEKTGTIVPEVGYEHLPQHLHPLLPRQVISATRGV